MADGGIFVYVSNAESRYISVMKLDSESGEVSLVQEVAVTGKVMPMAVSPERRFLFAALRSLPYSVASFSIDTLTGRLTHLANAPLPGSMVYISTDRTGRFLLGSSIPPDRTTQSSMISVSAIGPHGFVQQPHQVIRTEPKAHCILADPCNRHVLITSCDGDLVLPLRFDATTGQLSSNALVPVRVKPKAGPRHFVFHPNNRLLYLLNETDESIYAFSYDAISGTLNELQIVSALPPDSDSKHLHAFDLHLTPDGRFLYASERGSQTLAAFQVNCSSGVLSYIGNFPTEKGPRGFNIDPYGRHLVAVGEQSNGMTVYAIDSKFGNLTKLNEYPMGEDPNWVEIVRLP